MVSTSLAASMHVMDTVFYMALQTRVIIISDNHEDIYQNGTKFVPYRI